MPHCHAGLDQQTHKSPQKKYRIPQIWNNKKLVRNQPDSHYDDTKQFFKGLQNPEFLMRALLSSSYLSLAYVSLYPG